MEYDDLSKINLGKYSDGLRISLYNYMHGVGFELPLNHWFGFKIPKTIISPFLIKKFVTGFAHQILDPGKKLMWLGNMPSVKYFSESKKGLIKELADIQFVTKKNTFQLRFTKDEAEWLLQLFKKILLQSDDTMTIRDIELEYFRLFGSGFQSFIQNKKIAKLRENGLLFL